MLRNNLRLQRFLLRLYDIGAVQIAAEGEPGYRFKLHEANPTAPLSPIKFHICSSDVRPEGQLGDEEIAELGALFAEYIRSCALNVRAAAGIPNAGEPIAEALRQASPTPITPLWLQKITTATGRKIASVRDSSGYPKGNPVWLIDDLATRARTKLESIHALHDYDVVGCLVLLTYGPIPREELRAVNVPLHALANVRETVVMYLNYTRITSGQCRRVETYLSQYHRSNGTF